MSTDPNDKAAVEQRLWKELDHARFGMLGLMNSHQHFQPMTAFAEPESGQIWFFTKDDCAQAQMIALPPSISEQQMAINATRAKGLIAQVTTFNSADDDRHDMGGARVA